MSRLSSVLSFVLLVVLLLGCGDNLGGTSSPDATPSPDAGADPIPLERAHAGGNPNALAIVDGKAYLGVGPRLAIWDLATGTLVGESAPLRGNIDAVAIVGTRAYVAERTDLDAQIHVLDITDPAAITETGLVNLAPMGGGSVIQDLEPGPNNRLYVSDQEQGVFELDLANPDEPARVRMAPVLGAGELQLVGTRLYYFNNGFIGASLGALDTSMMLRDLGQSSLPVASVTVTGNLAVGAGLDGIFVYNVQNLANPVKRYELRNPEGGPFARAVAASGTRAWIPAHDGLHVLDLTMPASVKHVLAPHDSVGVNVAGVANGTLALATDRGDLHVLDVTAAMPANPRTIPITLCADCVGLAAVANSETLYIADIVAGLRAGKLVDLEPIGRSPAIPSAPDGSGLSLVFEDVKVDPATNRAYVADWLFGLRIYDVADPTAIAELGVVDTAGAPSGVAIAGDRAYISEGTGGGFLRTIDIANPAMPAELGFLETSKSIEVEVRGTLAYVADEELSGPSGLKIIDVSNATKPVLVGSYDQDCLNARDVALAGDHAIVACSFDGFHLVDISNPAQPTRVAVIPAPDITSAWSVAANGTQIALGHDRGVIVADISTPASPRELASHPTAFVARALDIPALGRIVAACGAGGIYQWQLDP